MLIVVRYRLNTSTHIGRIGCSWVTKAQAERAFKWLCKYFDYEVI